ncbi:MAG TPA: hypothetical protein VD978_27640 [Azospirillum sp.]|nr:hypothetical protein [Azospirillum sp.]
MFSPVGNACRLQHHPHTGNDGTEQSSGGVAADAKKSRALTIAEAAGIDGLRDIPAEVYERGMVEAARLNRPLPSILGDISGPGLAVTGYIAPPPGFTPSAALGLGLLSWLSTPPTQPPARFTTRIVVWLPAEATVSPEAAASWMDSEFRAAVFRAMNLTDLVERPGVFRPLLGPESHFTDWARPDCPAKTEGRREAYDPACSGTLKVMLSDQTAAHLPTLRPPPDALGISSTARGPTPVYPATSGMFRDWLKQRENLRALARELPRVFVIYLPPTPTELPVVLQGQDEWRFIAPQP